MPPIDPNDVSFPETIKQMLGMDKDAVKAAIEHLSATQLLDLTDAVAKHDRKVAAQILKPPAPKPVSSPAAAPPPPPPATSNTQGRARKTSTASSAASQSSTFQINDPVSVDGNKGKVSIPDAPGNNVGVTINGKLQMVSRNKITPVNEMVMGMTAIPDINRMLALAGRPNTEINNLPTQEIEVSGESDLDPECPEVACDACKSALETLTNSLPFVKMQDYREIRKSLNSIINQINETVMSRGRRI